MNMRAYSNKQEKAVAKKVSGYKTANSGATAFSKGDVVTEHVMIECKTVIKKQTSVSIKEDWLIKNKKEAFAMGKPYSALAFNYGPNEPNYFIINENAFQGYIEYIERLERGEIQ